MGGLKGYTFIMKQKKKTQWNEQALKEMVNGHWSHRKNDTFGKRNNSKLSPEDALGG